MRIVIHYKDDTREAYDIKAFTCVSDIVTLIFSNEEVGCVNLDYVSSFYVTDRLF